MSDLFVDNIKHQSSQGSGTITLGASGETIALASGASQTMAVNTPAFFAYNSAAISISNATTTKARLNTEDFDTASAFDSTTNYRFTVPSGEGGKYFFGYGVEARSTGDDIFVVEAMLYKNGSQVARADVNNNTISNASHRAITVSRTAILDLSASDYIEVYAYVDCDTPPTNFPQLEGGSTVKDTFLTGYKIIE